MNCRHNGFSVFRRVGALAALGVLLVGAGAQAHVFNQQLNGSDGEWRGNENYASWYGWSGMQQNYEYSSGERGLYAHQIFDLNTRILGNDRQIIRFSAAARAWYYPGPSYSRYQQSSLFINGEELVRCTADSCGEVRDVPSTQFYVQTRGLDYGTLLGGTWTLTSRVIGDISMDASLATSSVKYLGISTGLLGTASVTLNMTVHVLTRQTMGGTSDRNYRLMDIALVGEEYAKQGTTRNSAGQTKGSLSWKNREYVDMAHMNGAISYTKSSALTSKTITLVNVPTWTWTGQYIDDTGSTSTF